MSTMAMKILLIFTISCGLASTTFISGYSKVRTYNNNRGSAAPAPVSYIILPAPPIIHTGSAVSVPIKTPHNPPSPSNVHKTQTPPTNHNHPVVFPQNPVVPHRPLTYAAATEPSKPFSLWSIFQLPKLNAFGSAAPTPQTYGAIQSYAEPDAKPVVILTQRHPPLAAAYYTRVFPSEYANQGLRQVPPPKHLVKPPNTTTTPASTTTTAAPPTQATLPPQGYSLYLLPLRLNAPDKVHDDPAANYFKTFESVERANRGPTSTTTAVPGTTKSASCEKSKGEEELKIAVPVPIARGEETTEEVVTGVVNLVGNDRTNNSVVKAEARIMELYSDSKTEQWRPI